jgi:hypothetical protein
VLLQRPSKRTYTSVGGDTRFAFTSDFVGQTFWMVEMNNIKKDFQKIGNEVERWIKLAHACFKWRSLVLLVLHLWVLLTES